MAFFRKKPDEYYRIDCSGYRWSRRKIDVRTNDQIRADRLRKAQARGTHTQEEWTRLVELCNYRCVRCCYHVSELPGEILTKDHIVPLHMEGSTDAIENIQPLCASCNSSKMDTIDRVEPIVREIMRDEKDASY